MSGTRVCGLASCSALQPMMRRNGGPRTRCFFSSRCDAAGNQKEASSSEPWPEVLGKGAKPCDDLSKRIAVDDWADITTITPLQLPLDWVSNASLRGNLSVGVERLAAMDRPNCGSVLHHLIVVTATLDRSAVGRGPSRHGSSKCSEGKRREVCKRRKTWPALSWQATEMPRHKIRHASAQRTAIKHSLQ
ncbi:uncharacterized protein EI97DRAFT_22322 [Westerdykella ornata]|uniref:Uncharacterized protein n=1 Tax=Westerdykella ornata TaxID=318751 RepID=A0A6A6JYB7_WESOR|nr:uncharacterized protein EI97DRAFT_22322 [Westerdykella ornata]KAF2281185.1 hypothetical protein EI97DRAFT_22322 [Westerdykella ornata]